MGLATSESRRIGATSINMAVMNATKPPTVTEPAPERLCHNAMVMTAESASAAMSCVSGVIAAEAMVDFTARRCSAALSALKRPACVACAPCSRTMRCASTFSSTT